MSVSTGQHPVSGYAHSSAFDSGFLPVGEIHRLYYEQYGKIPLKPARPLHEQTSARPSLPPTTHSHHLLRPAIFLHGGPGGSTSRASTTFFSPSTYRVVLLDQRGAGKSVPAASLEENTSQHLVSDIEALRAHLHIEKWHLVFGGSWGSTLALLYAQTHPSAVGALVLRGIFTLRRAELEWFYGGEAGIRNVFPEEHARFVEFLPEESRAEPTRAYYGLLTGENEKARLAAARAWSGFELATSSLRVGEGAFRKLDDDVWTLAHSRIEAHYFVHGGWMEEGQLLRRENVDKIRHIPATIVQGRYDMVCPAKSAYDLHKIWPESDMYWIPDAGHSVEEPGIKQKLIEVCDKYAYL